MLGFIHASVVVRLMSTRCYHDLGGVGADRPMINNLKAEHLASSFQMQCALEFLVLVGEGILRQGGR